MTKFKKVFILAAIAVGITGCPKAPTGTEIEVPTTDTITVDTVVIDTVE